MPGPVLARTSSKNHFKLAASAFLCVVVRITKSPSSKPVASEAGLEMLKDAAAEEKQEFEEDPYEEKYLLADSEDEDDKIVEQDDGDISED